MLFCCFTECRQELHLALEQLQGTVSSGAYDPANLPPALPLHFLWNVRNIDWKRRLRKAHRSLLIRIVNLTSFMFVLDRRGGDRLSLEEGLWVEVRDSHTMWMWGDPRPYEAFKKIFGVQLESYIALLLALISVYRAMLGCFFFRLVLQFPCEEIPPLCCTEFGCQSDGFLLGTGGSCTYLIANQPGYAGSHVA